MSSTSPLPAAIKEYVEGANAFDADRIIRAFADDAFVNDARREIWGKAAIKDWIDREIVGDHVTMQVTKVVEHYNDVFVDGLMDGDYDKSTLPDELVLSHYFTVREDKIVSLIIIFNAAT